MNRQESLKQMREDYAAIKKVVKEFEEEQRHYYAMKLPEAVKGLLRTYQDRAQRSMANTKAFRDDMIVYLKALALIVDMAGNAGTHAEKNARLRGMSEQIESIIGKLREQEFNYLSSWRSPDLTASDFPVRKFMERAHEAEAKEKLATEQNGRMAKAIELLPPEMVAVFNAKLEQIEAEERVAKAKTRDYRNDEFESIF